MENEVVTSAQKDDRGAEKAGTLRRIAATADGSTTFDSLTTLPADLVPTGMQVNKFSGHYVHLTEPKYFDWDGFKYAVESYPGYDLIGVPPDYDMRSIAAEQLGESTGRSLQVPTYSSAEGDAILMPRGIEEQALENVLNWMTATLKDVVGMAINENELRATVTNVFTNLEWAHSSGFADFSSTSVGTNSSWEYRTVFAYPARGDPSRFLSVVTTIYLEANIKEESTWWGIETTTTACFKALIKPGKLLVTKGFKSPV